MFRNGLQGWHILVLLVVILLLFGAQRLPGLARSVGESLRIFKKEIKDVTHDDAPAATTNPTPAAPATEDPRLATPQTPGTPVPPVIPRTAPPSGTEHKPYDTPQ